MGFFHRINRKIVLYLLGVVTLILGMICIVPIIYSILSKETTEVLPFVISSLCFILLACVLMYMNRDYHLPISKKDGQLIIGLLWIIIPLLGAMPYVFYPSLFSFIDAVFESFSGFTTTGSTILDDLNSVPHTVLVYRAMTQWMGGLGFAVFIILILKGKAGLMINIFNAEFSSVYKNRLYPHLFDTALRIMLIYSFFTVACFLFLQAGSMNYFQAFCHSLTTIATGGFSTENGNIGVFTDSYTQWVIAIFMLLSGTSYFVYIRSFRRDFKVLKDEQFLSYLLLIVVCSLCFIIYWSSIKDLTIWDKVRESFFYVVSITSTTGFDIKSQHIGAFVSSALVFLMFIGGCSASSASGLKVIRVITLFKYNKSAMKKIFHPHAIIPVRINNKIITDEELKNTFGFFFLYIMVFIVGIFALACCGNDFYNSFTLSVANLGNIGPVVGSYLQGFTYSSLNIASQFVIVVLMLIGRLEIFAFFALLSKTLWSRN
ncbi:MAG: TrkH family potassium uptake protein [Bacteroidales bacterium]|nr:TrkH family potassium uptake protein [Bacteroidales bacterium]